MKASLTLCLALAALAPARAQVFHPEAGSGAVLGAIAGAVIGNNSGSLHHNPWQGAAIGAGAGLILGQLAGESRAYDRSIPAPQGAYVYREPQVVYARGYDRGRGYGYSHDHGRGYGYGYGRDYGYGYGGYTGYGYSGYGYSGGGSYAGAGLFWGGVLGAIIGHNSGDLRHNGWRGAAIGAGTGLLLGSIADANVRANETVVAAPVVQAQAAPAPAQQPVTIINNNYYNTPAPSQMAPANSLFGR